MTGFELVGLGAKWHLAQVGGFNVNPPTMAFHFPLSILVFVVPVGLWFNEGGLMKEVKLKCFSEKIMFQVRDIVIGFGCDWLSKKKGDLGTAHQSAAPRSLGYCRVTTKLVVPYWCLARCEEGG